MKFEAFGRLYVFIKIIGSDTLRFPLPPSEVHVADFPGWMKSAISTFDTNKMITKLERTLLVTLQNRDSTQHPGINGQRIIRPDLNLNFWSGAPMDFTKYALE